jgi:nucleoid-associated protein YgaU
MYSRRSLTIFILLTAIFYTGCQPGGEVIRETDERGYRRGKSLLREGRKDEALSAFLAVAQARPDAAESNLEAGLLYLNHVRDPVASIHHFRQYLGIKPNGEHAEFVGELITTARKEFARTLPGEPFGPQVDRADLMSSLNAMRQENQRLRQEVVDLRGQLETAQLALQRAQRELANRSGTMPIASGPVAPIVIDTSTRREARATETEGTRYYTVQAGDTLSRISQQVYGTSGRWSEIFEANRDQMASPNSLRVGQRLRIP